MAGFPHGGMPVPLGGPSAYPDRAALRNHNIFWTDVVELSSRSEFTRRELELLLNGDLNACVHGFFRRKTSDKVTVNIPSHVQQLRDQLLDFDSGFDEDNGNRALLSRYMPQERKSSASLNYGFNDGFTNGCSKGLAFLKKQLFDAFTGSATEFNPTQQGRTRKDDLVWTSQTQWQCPSISRNTSFMAQAFPPPCPDMAFYFPAFPRAHYEQAKTFPAHSPEARYARHVTFQNLSKETLWELGKHGLGATPFPLSGDTRQMTVLPAYPWFIALLGGNAGTDRHSEAAVAATATLKMYENAAKYSDPGNNRHEIPPVALMTSTSNEIRIWLGYSVKDDANIFTDSLSTQMICIWKGSAHDVFSNMHLRIILCNLHEWAVNSLRPQLSQYLDQWRRYASTQRRIVVPHNDPSLQSFGAGQMIGPGSSSAPGAQQVIAEAVQALTLTMEGVLKGVTADLLEKVKNELANQGRTPRAADAKGPPPRQRSISPIDPTQLHTPTPSQKTGSSTSRIARSQTAFKGKQPKLVPSKSNSHKGPGNQPTLDAYFPAEPEPEPREVEPGPSHSTNGQKSRVSIKDEGYGTQETDISATIGIDPRAGKDSGTAQDPLYSLPSPVEPSASGHRMARVNTSASASASTDYGSEVAWEECGDVP